MAMDMDSIYKLPKSKKVAILVVVIIAVMGLYAYAFFIIYHNIGGIFTARVKMASYRVTSLCWYLREYKLLLILIGLATAHLVLFSLNIRHLFLFYTFI